MTVLSRSLDVDAQLRALESMDGAGLRAEWRRLYRSTPPKRVSRELLILGVAWKIQERVVRRQNEWDDRSGFPREVLAHPG